MSARSLPKRRLGRTDVDITPVGFGGTGTGVGFGVGRGDGAVLGLRGESVAAGLVVAWVAGVGLTVGAEAGPEQATPMITIATNAAAAKKSAKLEWRIRVSPRSDRTRHCDPHPVGQ